MANGKITLGKQSGGELALVIPDGVSNTEVIVPESGELVNKDYADLKQSKSELAYNVDTSSYIPNTLASGAIIERGSNANGEYIKFADGTLICTANLPDEVDYWWGIGSWFRNSNFPLVTGWTFPYVFSSVPIVQITSMNDAENSGNIEGILTQHYTTSYIRAFFDGKATANIRRVICIKVAAIGRWK